MKAATAEDPASSGILFSGDGESAGRRFRGDLLNLQIEWAIGCGGLAAVACAIFQRDSVGWVRPIVGEVQTAGVADRGVFLLHFLFLNLIFL